jgi:cell wall-associated NlpC family hydrolase
MASRAAISGLALSYMTVGAVLVWSGVENQTIGNSITSLVQGKAPAPGPQSSVVSALLTSTASQPQAASEGSEGSVTSSLLANDALAFVGHKYVYGGAPGTNAQNGWDCSSFMNYVIGAQNKMAIPGYAAGTYNGSVHGPPTGAWLLWNGVTGISKASLEPGDLIVWQTHMGMCTGSGNMVSALNASLGTRETTISGGAPPGEVAFYKRLVA